MPREMKIFEGKLFDQCMNVGIENIMKRKNKKKRERIKSWSVQKAGNLKISSPNLPNIKQSSGEMWIYLF